MIIRAPDIDIDRLSAFTDLYFGGPCETIIPVTEVPDRERNVVFVEGHHDSKHQLFVKVADGSIVGFLHVSGNARTGLDHTASLGMGLLPDFRGQGFGTELLRTSIQWFNGESDLAKIELVVLVNNAIACRLYQKHGFVEEGYRKHFYRNASGEYIDAREMALFRS